MSRFEVSMVVRKGKEFVGPQCAYPRFLQLENRGTLIPDKPDFRVLNPHATHCVGVFVFMTP